MALSVCCLTNDRPALVAEMLTLFRPVADEIFVAVDARVDPRRLGPLVDVADTTVRFEYDATPERARPWLVASCAHPLVLMVDGDEVPSQALLAALADLVADDGAEQFRVTRRWLFPDERWWLAERPWCPDFQLRLFRRGPQLDFDLRFHGGVRAAVPARYVMEPLYHLACVTRPFAERRRAARAYDAARPGLVAVGGGPMNDTLYVPEHFATHRPVPTPPEDGVAIRRVIDAPDGAATSVELPLVGRAEIDRHHPVDPLDTQGYRVELRVVEADLRTDPGNDTHLLVDIHNTGATTIRHTDAPGTQVRVATRLDHRDPRYPVPWWARTTLPCDIPPGEHRVVEAIVHVPDTPGTYTVHVDLLNERGRWFECATSAELAVATRWGRASL